MATICQTYRQAPQLASQGVQVLSVDEKTGIQAVERLHPDKPMLPGSPVKREFEYIRHGTQSLIASLDVATGKPVESIVQETRTEQDFTAHIARQIPESPGAQVIFVADQLNTHVSEGVVRVVAKLRNRGGNAGREGQSGCFEIEREPAGVPGGPVAPHSVCLYAEALFVVESDRDLVWNPEPPDPETGGDQHAKGGQLKGQKSA